MAEEVSVHAIAEKGFAQSSLYDSVRPSYKHESVEFLLKKLRVLGEDCVQEVTVLELGAGTGLFTRAMVDVLAANRADKRVQIIATEPLASMCEKLRDHCPGIEIRQCRAESTGKRSAKNNRTGTKSVVPPKVMEAYDIRSP